MFHDDPLSPTDVCTLVTLIDKRSGWQTRADLILLLGGRPGGGWFTSYEVAEYVGRGPGTCRRALQTLEADRVIVRDGGEGGRRFWCELNPDWESWKVPWRFPLRTIRQRVAYAQAEADRPPVARLIARPYGARYPAVIARLSTRDEGPRTAREVDLSRAIGTRDNRVSAGVDRAFAPQNGRSRHPVSRAKATRDNPGRSEEEVLSSRVSDTSPPHDGNGGAAAPQEEEVISISESDRRAARQAVFAQCRQTNGRRPWLQGRPARQLDELVARHGAEAVIAAAGDPSIPPGEHLPPRLIEVLADILDAGQGAQPAGPDLNAERMRLEAQLEGQNAHIATFEPNGWPVPPEEIERRDELAERLAALGSPSYDERH